MRHLNYTLTPSRINNVKGKARPYKLADGGGLVNDFLLITIYHRE